MATDWTSFSSDGFESSWFTWDGSDTVSVSLQWENEAWTALSTLSAQSVQFVQRISPAWSTRQFMLFRDLDQPDLWLANDGRGRWGEVNGAHRPDLDGCVDVDVAGSPFPLTVPMRRLPLEIGHAAELPAARVDVQTLGVVPHLRRLTRLERRRWRLQIPDIALDVSFDVDDHAVALDVPHLFHRSP